MAWLINSEKSMKDAQRLTQKLKLDPSTFTTATSLYEKISLQLDIIKRVAATLESQTETFVTFMSTLLVLSRLESSRQSSLD
uniref:Uncharacterized protein n=1 Tax=Timema douglasi TaxID=61478 RepID=A0A7R8ZFH1_TIMDO|nr:unnamed protein product [Timema douglasi]